MIRILEEGQASSLLPRSADRMQSAISVVAPIIADVRAGGDAAVLKYAKKLDGFTGDSFYVATGGELDSELGAAVDSAIANVRLFAEQQLVKSWTKTIGDRELGQIIRPLDRVGAYVPSGRYPLLSTMLMAVVPAQVAGVADVTVACPRPTAQMLALASRLGIERVLCLGGAQAIAAMAYGTESIGAVQRIVGPGNAYVAAAKKLVSADVAIDFVAGPSEIVIVANDGNPQWIAADMLAQSEHDVDARAILLTTSTKLANAVQHEVGVQLAGLSTADVAGESIRINGAIVICESEESAFRLVNLIAPEHLSLYDPSQLDRVRNAGSVFIGQYSTEAAGDYASGPNHILPTAGYATIRGGLSVNDFIKVITTQQLSKKAIDSLGATVTTLARAEGLEAHARSVEMRLNG
jgi:histidinol dehydrogenase